MENINKTREQLIEELEALYQRVAELERLKTEREHAEQLLEALFISSPIGIYIVQGRKFQMLNQEFPNSVHPNDRGYVTKFVDEALCEKRHCSIDHRIVVPEGSEHCMGTQFDPEVANAFLGTRQFATLIV